MRKDIELIKDSVTMHLWCGRNLQNEGGEMNTNEKLREALEKCLVMFESTDKDPIHCVRVMLDAKTAVKEALALPRRNCDVGSAEEQYARFKKWCEGEFYKRPINPLTGEPCKPCPCYSVSANGVDGCNYLRWAQMPYEEVK